MRSGANVSPVAVSDMGIRKNYRNLTAVERDHFVNALLQVKANGIIDHFAAIHEMHFFMGIHVSSHFLPWHREMILRFERELQKVHPDVTIPYWNSTVNTSPSDPLWDNSFLGQFDSAWGLARALGSDTLPTPQEVHTTLRVGTYDPFWRDLEGDIHNPPHRWVEGIMGDVASPGDPVFYLHHAWIDLLWSQWQLAHHGAPFMASGAGVGLNDPMMEWPDRTPADVLDHHALGYSYDIEYPIVHFVTAQNISGTSPCTTYVDHPLTNANPNTILFVTHNWNPLGMPSDQGQSNNHPIGVWYAQGRQQWGIFNEDEAAMTEGVAFNVSVYANLLGP